jgi:hypothetical protein
MSSDRRFLTILRILLLVPAPSDEPRRVVKTMWKWIGITLGLLVLFVVLYVLGYWYD